MARCWPLDFADSKDFPCVRVIDHGERYVNLQYDLLTGQLGPCHGRESDDISKGFKEIDVGVYLNAECDGEPHFPMFSAEYMTPGFTRTRGIFPVAGQWWYPDEICSEPAKYWGWDPATEECYVYGGQARLCPLKPVPTWAVELLPNPPYSMTVEYD